MSNNRQISCISYSSSETQ